MQASLRKLGGAAPGWFSNSLKDPNPSPQGGGERTEEAALCPTYGLTGVSGRYPAR
jgi:hypothetical protein